jgi:putative FmdB family regulatory protein
VPVYEFACNACGAPVSVFVRSISAPVDAVCTRCGGRDLRRLVSSFAVLRPGGGMDSLEGLEGVDENDPKAMAAWARRMQREMGDDAGPEFEDMVQRMERGESLDGMDGGFDGADDDF